MRSLLTLILTIGLGAPVSAMAQEITVSPLFTNATFRTHLSIPFRVGNGTLPIDNLISVSSANEESCKALVDPNIPQNFLLKCLEPNAAVSLKITYASKGQIKSVVYGPIKIANISETGIVAPPPGGGSGPSPEFLEGQALYNQSGTGYNSCKDCHQNPGNKAQSITLSSLKASFNNVPSMKSGSIIKAGLTEAQMKNIVTYVQSFK